MASQKEIHVVISGTLNNGLSSGDAPLSSEEKQAQTMGKKTEPISGDNMSSLLNKFIVREHQFERLTQAKNIAGTFWNRYVDMKEDYLAQRDVQNVTSVVGRTISLGHSVMQSARLAGNIFGAGSVAATIAAPIAAAAAVGVQWLSTADRVMKYNEQYNGQNIQTNFTRVRMGLIDGGRGTDN